MGSNPTGPAWNRAPRASFFLPACVAAAMEKNIGSLDAKVRRAVAAALLLAAALLFVYLPGRGVVLGTAALVLAGVVFVVSTVRVCPLYLPFGINTRRKK